jgi:hypothetical protein
LQKTISEERKKERHRAVETEGLAESRSSIVLAESKTSSKSKTLRPAPTVLSMWPQQNKNWMKESQNIAVLAQRNGLLAPNFPTK